MEVAQGISPSLDEVRRLAAEGYNLIPVWRDDLADTETPVSAYWRLNGDGPGFLLESVEGGERMGRFSFIGGEPLATVTLDAGQAVVEGAGGGTSAFSDPTELLASMLARYRQAPAPGIAGRFTGGLVGYLAYEAARYFERLPAPKADPVGVADGVFFLVDSVAVFDHLLHRRTLIAHARLEAAGDVDAAYAAACERVDAMAGLLDDQGAGQPPGPGYAPAPSWVDDPAAEGEWNVGRSSWSRCAAARSTSWPATSSRYRSRGGSRRQPRPILSICTACCAR
jgi:anthranilate synthase component 1